MRSGASRILYPAVVSTACGWEGCWLDWCQMRAWMPRCAQVAAGAVLGVVVGYLVGVSWSHPLPMPVP